MTRIVSALSAGSGDGCNLMPRPAWGVTLGAFPFVGVSVSLVRHLKYLATRSVSSEPGVVLFGFDQHPWRIDRIVAIKGCWGFISLTACSNSLSPFALSQEFQHARPLRRDGFGSASTPRAKMLIGLCGPGTESSRAGLGFCGFPGFSARARRES